MLDTEPTGRCPDDALGVTFRARAIASPAVPRRRCYTNLVNLLSHPYSQVPM